MDCGRIATKNMKHYSQVVLQDVVNAKGVSATRSFICVGVS